VTQSCQPRDGAANRGSVCDRDQRVGDKLEMIVGHAYTMVRLHERYFGMRNGVVETVWEISARGRID
jgi:hypothetical protein